jgi:hypothetical protein
MTIRISCECGKELHAPDEFAGRLTRCPVCKREVTLSAASTAVQSATAASSAPLPPPIPTAVQSVAPAVPAAASPTSPPKQGKTAWQAVVSLLLGFLGVCLPLLASLPAILPGVLAFGAIKRGGGQIGGKGMAITGLVLGIATTLLCAPLYCFLGYFGYSLLVAGRDAPKHTESSNNLVVAGTESNNNLVVDGDAAQLRIKSRNNLERIGIAMHDYHQAVGTFPTEERRPGGKFRVSWRVRLLPYLREPGVMAYDENEEWDSPKNKRLLASMPKVFLDPRFQSKDDQSKGLTYYRGFAGQGNILGSPNGVGIEGVAGGNSNTLLVVEAGEPIPWTKPEDPTFNENGPFGGPKRESPFLILYADGHISSIPTSFDPKTLHMMIDYRNTTAFTAP